MPMLDTRRTPNVVTRAHFDNRSTPLLGAAHAVSDDQVLTRRMRMPVRPRARLERHVTPEYGADSFAANRGSTRTLPVKYFSRALR